MLSMRIQLLTARFINGFLHLPYDDRLRWLIPHPFNHSRLQEDLKGDFDLDLNSFFVPSIRPGIIGYSLHDSL